MGQLCIKERNSRPAVDTHDSTSKLIAHNNEERGPHAMSKNSDAHESTSKSIAHSEGELGTHAMFYI